MTVSIGLEGLALADRELVGQLVERMRSGGFEVLWLRWRVLEALLGAAELAGDKAAAAELGAQLKRAELGRRAR